MPLPAPRIVPRTWIRTLFPVQTNLQRFEHLRLERLRLQPGAIVGRSPDRRLTTRREKLDFGMDPFHHRAEVAAAVGVVAAAGPLAAISTFSCDIAHQVSAGLDVGATAAPQNNLMSRFTKTVSTIDSAIDHSRQPGRKRTCVRSPGRFQITNIAQHPGGSRIQR
jgi:hypothetical protein